MRGREPAGGGAGEVGNLQEEAGEVRPPEEAGSRAVIGCGVGGLGPAGGRPAAVSRFGGRRLVARDARGMGMRRKEKKTKWRL
jgi:hypothetical protein